MSEPKYITELKQLYYDMDKRLALMCKDMKALPKMEEHLGKLNDKVDTHDKGIALLNERQQNCPARKAYGQANPNKKLLEDVKGNWQVLAILAGAMSGAIVVINKLVDYILLYLQ